MPEAVIVSTARSPITFDLHGRALTGAVLPRRLDRLLRRPIVKREIDGRLPIAGGLDVQHDDQFVQLGVVTGAGRDPMNVPQLLVGQSAASADAAAGKSRCRSGVAGGIDEPVVFGVLVEAPRRREVEHRRLVGERGWCEGGSSKLDGAPGTEVMCWRV
ncbi:hypothetical protein [Nocardia asiatica]|uniref:hypothetical protein n=1 Tax=Nocardia asiatica TaxID=209252 RepID=UPI00245848FB|nr:hypothetical protein [Nocardia asiatica]